jgi:hypothetical protein
MLRAMAEHRIRNKGLWRRLANIKKKRVWTQAALALGLKVTRSSGGTSHIAIRLPGFEREDIKGLVATVYEPMRKDISERLFKKLLILGYDEDDIWKALGMR